MCVDKKDCKDCGCNKKKITESTNSSKQLLIDTMLFVPQKMSLKESTGGQKLRIVSGVVQRANSKNQNERIYPKKVLMREVQQYVENFINKRNALGELDHPDRSVVNLGNVSHNMTKLWWNGDDLMGEMEILPTPAGRIAEALLDNNIALGISSRGMGSVKNIGEGVVEVDDDFEIVCWDLVSNPSTHGAFVSPVNEGVTKQKTPVNKHSKVHEIISDIFCDYSGICKIDWK